MIKSSNFYIPIVPSNLQATATAWRATITMPPPAFTKNEAQLEAGFDDNRRSPNEVKERIEFSKFPAEIQHMIWVEAFLKPACHTFKLVYRKPSDAGDPWSMSLQVLPSNQDPSAFRRWKAMLWNGQYKLPDPSGTTDRSKLDLDAYSRHSIESGNLDDDDDRKPMIQKSREAVSKLANASFQAGFRRAMVAFQPIRLLVPADKRKGVDNWRDGAAIDTATDLVIIEFDRGTLSPALHWFEHSTGRMAVDDIRRDTRHLKRVAVHYKKSHKRTIGRDPFQCYCPAGTGMGCIDYKACPVEQACFLDCFANLEEFYYVVEVTKKKEVAWKTEYKDYVRRHGYKLKTSDKAADKAASTLELKHFYDKKKEYIQLCPRNYLKFLPKDLSDHEALPLESMKSGGARECLIKVMKIYRGFLVNETFKNPVEQRKAVKFGILFAYDMEE